MNPERLHRIQTLYEDASALPTTERAGYLDKACAGDGDLRLEIESLLACQSESDTYLDKPAMHIVAETLADEGAGQLVGRVLGRYQLLSLVGRGGMGDVYCAVDSRLNRLVAVKILPPYMANDIERSRQFQQEARTIAAVNHPHICTLHDADHDEGTYYLVFEYLVGELLSDRLHEGALPPSEALKYAIQIAEALEHAHQQGVIHHDLKPRNIMLTRTGVKILDFGVAELRSPEGEPEESVSPKSGTLAYMAPEQIEGRETDARTDIFAFGTILYEMVSGRTAAGAGARRWNAATSIGGTETESHVLAALYSVIVGCLAEQPSQRWQSVSGVLLMLRRIAS